ncbi:CubicO group peptidase (beta-lactamase class C family) [Pantoea allii]|uniref:CubicO group peptidase (Beta-lactamase class C family) n=1 Tax=Pantoea allii TaxID=574096 RepID=A0A2V2BEH0_9GAMM|nr:CubicO group peptidase (beta-lactamase class C family) [Pantoea allii]
MSGCSRLFKRSTMLIICTLLLAACGTLSQTSAPTGDRLYLTHSDFHDNLDDLVRHYMQRKQVSGISIAIIHHHNPTLFYSAGVTDDVHRYPITPDTLFALGSLSKGVTAEVIIEQVNEGQLHWSDTLADLLPSDVRLSQDARHITLLQLVTHTSGLPRQDMDLPMFMQFIGYLRSGQNFYGNLDSDAVLEYLADFSAPRQRVPQYSNLGYALLGYILRERCHNDIETLAHQRIFRPLGMNNTGFVPERLSGFATRALGHAGDQPKFIPRGDLTPDWRFHRNMVAAGSLYSNARDLSVYLRAHLNAVADPALNRAFAEVNKGVYQQGSQTQNLAWVTDRLAGRNVTYQVGYIGGYSAFIGFDRQAGNAIVVLQNAFNWSNYLGITLLLNLAEKDR